MERWEPALRLGSVRGCALETDRINVIYITLYCIYTVLYYWINVYRLCVPLRGRQSIPFRITADCPYKLNQNDALFVYNNFRVSTSTCFRRIYSPSSGGTPYIYNSWYLLFFLVCFMSSWIKVRPVCFICTNISRGEVKNTQLIALYSIYCDL